ncbi:MAG: MBL fold metallo-hydrolase [Gemmatimonadales bacterium]|nr:MBL fold metallo-hydrolase [Gemmatimonadales bacterium]
MRELVVTQLVNGRFVENCWLVGDPDTREAVLIDPGEEPERFLAALRDGAWRLTAIWLTHAHIDHVLGVPAVTRATGAPVLLHPDDRPLYDGVPAQAQWMGLEAAPLPPPDGPLADGDELAVGRFRFRVVHTPGHSPGSVSFVGEGRIFGGDVLFRDSIGRTDLPGGNFFVLMKSIHKEILSLPDATILHSGHGPDTTIGAERVGNPFITGAVAT